MKFYGHIDLDKNRLNQAAFEIVNEFPALPVVGQVCFKDTNLYCCVAISDTPVWVKLSENIRAVISSFTNSITWTVNHAFGTDVIVQVFDENGLMIIPENVNTSVSNRVEITFAFAQSGKAVVLAGGASEVLTDMQGQLGAANGIATLGADGKVVASQLPDITITDTFVATSQAEMLALTAQTGDVAIRTDVYKTFILRGSNPADVNDWQQIINPLPVDAYTKAEVDAKIAGVSVGSVAFADITSKPTTISGYGITDAYTKTEVDTALSSVNAATAVKLATARTIALSGAVSGSATFDGSANTTITTTVAQYTLPYDIGAGVFGTTTAAEVVVRIRAARAFRLVSGQPNAQAKAGTAATASTVFTIAKNGSAVGTITFGAASTTGTFSFASNVDLVVGDLLTVTGPASPDATLADIDFTLVGLA